MTESIVTADEISATADRYVVKKSGNMIVVAGWTADDTVAAGNALINWLKANVQRIRKSVSRPQNGGFFISFLLLNNFQVILNSLPQQFSFLLNSFYYNP